MGGGSGSRVVPIRVFEPKHHEKNRTMKLKKIEKKDGKKDIKVKTNVKAGVSARGGVAVCG